MPGLDTEIFEDYTSLRRKLRALPRPKARLKRVFRGQWRGHGQLRPSAHRGAAMPKELWYSYGRRVAEALLAQSPSEADWLGQYDSERLASIVATDAALQHYGAGSPYLDVTHSLPIALWFALHKTASSEVLMRSVGADGAIYDFPLPTTSYSRNPDHGFLYVLDVPEWTGGERTHGRLFDIAQVSVGGHHSERARRQSGCLVFADERGELSDHLAADPIAVAWPMRGAPEVVDAPAGHLFPAPSEDDFLSSILDVPLVPDLDVRSTPRRTATKHPLGVRLFDIDQLPEFEQHLGVVEVPLLFPDLKAAMERALAARAAAGPATPDPMMAAVPILFEAPIAATRAHERWNERHLLAALAVRTRPRSPDGSTSARDIDLLNVFAEFGPLEFDRWFVFEDPRMTVFILRGLWFIRRRGESYVQAFVDWYDQGRGRELIPMGPFRVDNAADGSIVLLDGADAPIDAHVASSVKAGLFPVLTLLRDLEPSEKPYSYQTGIVSGRERTMFTLRTRQIAELRLARFAYRATRYYLPKELGTDRAYTGLM